MLKELSAWRVTEELQKGTEVYAIIIKGERVEARDARHVTLAEHADEKNIFYVKRVEDEEDEYDETD